MYIQELDLEIKHKPGKHNTCTNADALSRNPTEESVQERKQTAVTCAVAAEQLNGPADVTTQSNLKELNQSMMELYQQ